MFVFHWSINENRVDAIANSRFRNMTLVRRRREIRTARDVISVCEEQDNPIASRGQFIRNRAIEHSIRSFETGGLEKGGGEMSQEMRRRGTKDRDGRRGRISGVQGRM